MKNDREYRSLELRIIPGETGEKSYEVEGYASTFDSYVLFTADDGTQYSERIEPTAFDNADMSDVVFRVDHEGRVYARTSAGTVRVNPDAHGLKTWASLAKTKNSRELFDDIEAGNYPQMSFAFTVRKDRYEKETRTRVIEEIEKVFDVSPVSFPANPNTALCVKTRDYFHGVMEMEQAERLARAERERQKAKIRLLTEVL